MPNREKAMGASELVQAIRSRNKDKWSLSRVAATRLVQANYDMRTAQRDRAPEAAEKLRDSVKSFINAGDHSSRSEWMRAYEGLKIALAATEPKPVEGIH